MRDNTFILINQTCGLSHSLKENIFLFQGRRGGTKHLVCTRTQIYCIKLKLSWRPDLFSGVFFHSHTFTYLRQSCPHVIMYFWNQTSIPVSFLQNSQGFLHYSRLPFPQGFYNIHKESVNSNSKTENTFFDEASCISCTSWRCSLLPDREQWHDKQGEKELLTSLMCRDLALTEKSFACLLFF